MSMWGKRVLLMTVTAAVATVTAVTLALLPAQAAPSTGDLETKGIITAIPSGTRFGIWTIGGNDYQAVTGTAVFDENSHPLALNSCAQVKYVMQGAVRLATRIKSDDTCGVVGNDNDVDVKATVQSFPPGLIGDWLVGSVTYTAVPSTSFEQLDGPFAIGACVEVKHPLSSTVALSIKTEDSIECGPNAGTIARAKGMLTAFPSSLVGTWVVNITTYQILSTTQLNTRHGDFYVGACVEVHYLVSDTNRTATEVETESLDDCSRSLPITPTLEARGIISSRPPTNTLFGTWLIGGNTYEAITGTTQFEQEHGALLVETCTKVNYIDQNGQRVAVRISSKEMHDCHAPNEDNELYGAVTALPGTPDLLGIWGIGGQGFVVTATTLLQRGPFTAGLIVEVHYVRAVDGALIATRIEGERSATDDRVKAKTYGILQSRPASPALAGTWAVASATYSATNSTRLFGSLEVGNCVEVQYLTDASGARIAYKIATQSGDDCLAVGQLINRAYGSVQQMPPNGFVGTWLIGGVTFDASVSTRFKQERGALCVGSYVEVHYQVIDGVNVAQKIETHVPPRAGNLNTAGMLSFGVGNQPSATGPLTWVIGDQVYTVLGATMLNDAAGAMSSGHIVVVNAYADATTSAKVATSIIALGNRNVYLPMVRH